MTEGFRRAQERRLVGADASRHFVTALFTAVVMAYMGFGVWALVGAQLAQASVHTLGYWIFEPHSMVPSLRKDAFKDLFGYSAGTTLARIPNAIAQQGDRVMVGRYLGDNALGIYGRAVQLMLIPAQLFGQVTSQVLFPALAEIQEDKAKLKRAYATAMGVVTVSTLPLGVLMAAVSGEILFVVLGDGFLAADTTFKILSFAIVIRTGYKLSDSLASATGAVYERAWRQGVYAVAVLVGSFIGSFQGLSGIALGATAAFAINYVLMGQLSLRLCQMSWREFAGAHVPSLLLATAVGALTVPVADFSRRAGHPPIVVILLATASAGLALVITLRLGPWVPGSRPLVGLMREMRGLMPTQLVRPFDLVCGNHYRPALARTTAEPELVEAEPTAAELR